MYVEMNLNLKIKYNSNLNFLFLLFFISTFVYNILFNLIYDYASIHHNTNQYISQIEANANFVFDYAFLKLYALHLKEYKGNTM